MPPKKNANAAAEGVDSTASGAVVALCHLIMSCDEFKVDYNKVAPVLGIAQGRNVPRKINSVINQHGFEFKGGKITQSGNQVPDGVAGPSDNAGAAEDGNDDKTKKAPTAPKPKGKIQQGPVPKKRKLADTRLDEDSSGRVKEEDGQEP